MDYSSNSINFVRYYNSLFESQSVLGKQWKHNYLASLTIAETIIQVNRQDGKILEFHNESGIWMSDADVTETLAQVDSTWEFKTTDDRIERYNDRGQLLSSTSRNSQVTQYHYNANDLLAQITGPFGRTLGFAYDISRRLISLTTAENTQIHYSYDTNNNLISVTYPDNTPGNLTDNPYKIYHYEDVNFPHHLTGITNENGIRYATWSYNNNGLAILSEHANSAEKVELVYNSDGTTTVTNSLGQVKTYTFETQYGIRKPGSIRYDYDDGQQAVVKTQAYTYYSENGQLKTVTDYNDYVTYFEYNSRGLVTLKTLAQGTTEEYTISTTWHQDYRLPAARIYPDKTEIYNYDSYGRLMTTQTTAGTSTQSTHYSYYDIASKQGLL